MGSGSDWLLLSEGGPCCHVEIEVNADSKSTNERGPFLVGSLGLSCMYKRFLFCLGCSNRPSAKYFFPHRTWTILIRLSSSKQAAVMGRLPLSVRLWPLWSQKTQNVPFCWLYHGLLLSYGLYYIYMILIANKYYSFCVFRQDTSNLIARCGEWDTQTEREPMPFQDRKVFFSIW